MVINIRSLLSQTEEDAAGISDPTSAQNIGAEFPSSGFNTLSDAVTSGVNDQLQLDSVLSPVQPVTNPPQLNIQVSTQGFGSYLDGILPNDIAVSAGAFSASMQQIKNILNVDFEKFSQVVYGIETTKDLNLVNGTDVPTNIELSNQGYELTGLGSGPINTYTISDGFGAMSGLPYPWELLYNSIKQLQTLKLQAIYNQIYLAVTWSAPTVSVTYSTNTSVFPNEYTLTGVSVTDSGGGYGRNGAGAPTIVINNSGGATITTTIGTDNSDLSTYGKLLSVSVSGASPTTSIPTFSSIEYPPSTYVSYPYTGGSNSAYLTVGWPATMNSVLTSLITDANSEIANIRTTQPINSVNLNQFHDVTGSHLTIEQRARFISLGVVPSVKRDIFLNLYPQSLLTFTDVLPELAKNTLPHMQAQTLEAISNLDLVGGQSIVASMREARNSERLGGIGVPIDDSLPEFDELPILISDAGQFNNLQILNVDGNIVPIANPLSVIDGDLSNVNVNIGDGSLIGAGIGTGVILSLGLPAYPSNQIDDVIVKPIPDLQILNNKISYLDGTPVDVGQALPGSFSPSKAINLIPPNLKFSSATTLSGTFSVAEAIDHVIECNCDCWVN